MIKKALRPGSLSIIVLVVNLGKLHCDLLYIVYALLARFIDYTLLSNPHQKLLILGAKKFKYTCNLR